MGQRSNDAARKDAQIMSSKEECASGTEQSANNAVLMDAIIKSNEMEFY